jgi:NAD(P)-dependent dehydrogenase (short-subunit alcohol dehydrogenase family)
LIQIGEPTILINNAGVVQGKLVIDLSVEDVEQYVVYVISTNFISQFVFQNVWCKHFLSFLDFKGLPSYDVKE